MRITAKKDSNLLELLGDFFQETSTTKLKKMIMYGCVSYKGAIVKSWELIIPKGEAVDYTKYKGGAKIAKQKSSLPVIYEDQNLIIVNKSCGLRFLSKVSYKGQTVSSMVKSYLKRKYGNRENAFAIYKVDDLDSGLCILARDKRTANILSLAWESEVEKKYLGIVENPLVESKKSFRSYELQGTHQKNEQSESRTISLQYELKENIAVKDETFHLIEIKQTKGDAFDCRNLFEQIGNPIVADSFIGKSNYNNNFMKLCLVGLKFKHPITKSTINLHLEAPKSFYSINL
jgi:23S rRNA-/tRNA-specific pseudouridylate synthase